MADQRRIKKEKQKRRQITREDQNKTQINKDIFKEADSRLDKLDAAIDDILSTPAGSGKSEKIGSQDRHHVRFLSDEYLWLRFRQKPGE